MCCQFPFLCSVVKSADIYDFLLFLKGMCVCVWGGGGEGARRKLFLPCLSSVSYCDACEASALNVWKRDGGGGGGGRKGGGGGLRHCPFFHSTLCDASCSVCVEKGWGGGGAGRVRGQGLRHCPFTTLSCVMMWFQLLYMCEKEGGGGGGRSKTLSIVVLPQYNVVICRLLCMCKRGGGGGGGRED